jgi:hypothetical protein
MRTFKTFYLEESRIVNEYDYEMKDQGEFDPQKDIVHDPKVVPAVRHTATNAVYYGHRGQSHMDIAEYHKLPPHKTTSGFYHPEKKIYFRGSGVDSTDLMTDQQRHRWVHDRLDPEAKGIYKKGSIIPESNFMYHGSKQKGLTSIKRPDEDYMMDRMAGAHFAADPHVSHRFTSNPYHPYGAGAPPPPDGQVYKTRAPKRSELDVVPQKRYKSGALQSDQNAVAAHIAGTVFAQPEHKELFKAWVKHARNVDDATADKVHASLSVGKAPADPETYGTAASKSSNSFKSYVSNFDAGLHMQPTTNFRRDVVSKYHDMMAKKGKVGTSL